MVLRRRSSSGAVRQEYLTFRWASRSATERTTWTHNRWYREWVELRGIIDAVCIFVAHDPSMVGSLAFGRHGSAGEIGEAEMAGLRLISPHIRRAVTISKLFDLKGVEVSTFSSTIEAFAAGVVLVDENGCF
jgi:hypothetical protein